MDYNDIGTTTSINLFINRTAVEVKVLRHLNHLFARTDALGTLYCTAIFSYLEFSPWACQRINVFFDI